ncbi:MAG: MBOAT family protein [Roseburia sp.]|nr:MBOAT family protein [Roseburia sp.]MCM1098609.1 MBOAT family protein [Ruminococcus flavefaciens]
MVFSSVMFLFRFLPVFLICYYVFPGRMKNIILFLGSLFFYAWGEPVYVLLMFFSTGIDYFHGRMIERYRGGGKAKAFLVSSVLINLALLCFFKYADFLVQTVNSLFGTAVPLLNLRLPIGISFYTFQTMSYTIDVYRGEAKVQKNLLDFGVFVAMFPQLIAGPIVKYRDVEEKLRLRSIGIEDVSRGMRRFCVGLAKKVLLANNIGLLWSEISGLEVGGIRALTAWIGLLAYAFQIYFDFSGYSDMAIGLGEMLGFSFPENFRYPYISASVTEFWRRWHISLGSWFREYVYIPLGGNRKGLPRQLVNILVVWMLTGIWHGAGWNFLLWGLWFALFLALEKLFLGKLLRALPWVFGFLYNSLIVLLGWVLFALEKPGQILGYLRALSGGSGLLDTQALYLGREYMVLLLIAAAAATPLGARLAAKLKRSGGGAGQALYQAGEKVIPAGFLLLAVAGIVDASYNPFLYFRF